ncbi:MAG: DUF4143 domain-containing protein [Chloroflexi bacterium]|nr:DUF4143 domain-containing protein [Chloroflexota bacterium]
MCRLPGTRYPQPAQHRQPDAVPDLHTRPGCPQRADPQPEQSGIEHAASGPMGGAIFENLVVAEMFKIYIHRGEEPALYYWRTATDSEVDLVSVVLPN